MLIVFFFSFSVNICSCQNWKILCSLTRPKAFYLKFSPNGTYLTLWELFTTSKDNPDGAPNLHIYKSDTGEEMLSIIQKRNSDWEPNWSQDESVVAFMLGGEAHFYETNGANGFSKSEKKVGSLKNGLLSIAPGNCPPFVAFYIPGVKDSPSMCKIFKYPNVNVPQPIACKSFFQVCIYNSMFILFKEYICKNIILFIYLFFRLIVLNCYGINAERVYCF